jgi:hypothetical protein
MKFNKTEGMMLRIFGIKPRISLQIQLLSEPTAVETII